MNYRRFGNTDLEVSEICFGPMRFAAKDGSDDELSRTGKAALRHALERGVNFVHSCEYYGTRWAIGEVLRDYPGRHEIRHIIKVGVPDFDEGGVLDPARFRMLVENALRDLHAERIDFLQHLQRARPNTDELRIPQIPAVHEAAMEIFEKLRDEGKVGYLLAFPYTPGFAAEALKMEGFSGMVAYYNAIEMEMAHLFPQLEKKGQGFFCIRPFMAGLLTDRRADRGGLPDGDRFRGSDWDAAYERLDRVRSALGDEVESWTRFSIQFALCHPLVTSLIVGLNSPEQVDGVLDAADGNYPSRAVFDRVLEVFEENGPVPAD